MLESFTGLLQGKEAQETVWTADVTYWLAGQPPARVRTRGWDTETGYLGLCRDLGCMPYYWYDKFWAGTFVSEHVQTSSETSGGTQWRTWQTPVGALREESQFVTESMSRAITKYPVETSDDLRVLLYILENSRWVPANIDDYVERMRNWSTFDGLPSLAMPRSPLSAFLVEWAGVQNGAYLMCDERDEVLACLNRLEDLEEAVLNALCDLAPPLVHFPDNLTSEVYTGFFDVYMAGCYEKRLSRLHSRGTKCAVHLDGTARGLLPKLIQVGMDAIEALTPAPVGDMSAAEMRGLAEKVSGGQPQVILWGGVPGAMFAPQYEWQDVAQHVEAVLAAWAGVPFVLGVADQVPPDGDIDRVRRVSDMVRQRVVCGETCFGGSPSGRHTCAGKRS